MAHFKVERSDTNLLSRVLTGQIRNKNVQTPVRALHLTSSPECEARNIRYITFLQINELYKSITSEALDKINGDIEKQQQFTASLENAIQRSPNPNALNLVFFSFSDPDGRIPTGRETEYLFDLLNMLNADVLVPPIIRGASGQTYLEFLDQFFTVYRTLNHRPVMGLIPYASYRELDPIMQFYEKQDVSLYAMDLHGRHPLRLAANISRVLRSLLKSEAESDIPHYLHGLNVGQGRALPNQPVKPAKDILAFEMGFDSFGPVHIPPKLTPDLYSRLDRLKKPPVRLFNREDYGYHVANKTILDRFPAETMSSVDVASLRRTKDYEVLRRLVRAFNAGCQVYEAEAVRTRIANGDALEPYLGSKEHAKNLVRRLFKLAKDVKQT
jgi:hypothetical protein